MASNPPPPNPIYSRFLSTRALNDHFVSFWVRFLRLTKRNHWRVPFATPKGVDSPPPKKKPKKPPSHSGRASREAAAAPEASLGDETTRWSPYVQPKKRPNLVTGYINRGFLTKEAQAKCEIDCFELLAPLGFKRPFPAIEVAVLGMLDGSVYIPADYDSHEFDKRWCTV